MSWAVFKVQFLPNQTLVEATQLLTYRWDLALLFFTRKSYEKQKRACRGNQAKMAKAKPYILAKTDISIGLCLGASPSYNTRKTSLSHIPAATVYLDRLIIHPEMKAQGTQSNSQEWYYVLCPPVLHCYHTMVWHAYGLPSNHLSACRLLVMSHYQMSFSGFMKVLMFSIPQWSLNKIWQEFRHLSLTGEVSFALTTECHFNGSMCLAVKSFHQSDFWLTKATR